MWKQTPILTAPNIKMFFNKTKSPAEKRGFFMPKFYGPKDLNQIGPFYSCNIIDKVYNI